MIVNPQIYADIGNGGNIDALNKHLAEGWDIKQTITKSPGGTAYTPIMLAIYACTRDILEKSGVLPSVKWLTEHGAKLNDKKGPAFPAACRFCNEETIRYLVANGADVNARSPVGWDAYSEAYASYKEKMDIFSLIQELGHSAARYGGPAFCRAVSEKNWEMVKFFIANGVDVNCCDDDGDTPICVAVMSGKLKMCQYLIEHGADLKKAAKKNGMSMYNMALELGNTKLAEYLKSLEPPETHTLEYRLSELKPFKLPKQLVEFLQSEQLRFELGDECEVNFIEFSPLMRTVQTKAKRQKILLISKEIDGYGNIDIAWNPKTKKIAYWDCEHEEFGNVATFEEFIKDMGKYMQKIIDGDYVEFSEWR